jgi:DNA invertase Pin-like site-specific DNA recombinase
MIYAYIRVSTDKQAFLNQQHEIIEYCRKESFVCHKWYCETISGTVATEDRELDNVLCNLRKGDVLIVSELSRLGRGIVDVLNTIERMKQAKANLICVKENIDTTRNDLNTKIMIMTFAMCAEIEREMISARTKEALAARKAAGVKLGRPCGVGRARTVKYDKYKEEIFELLCIGKTKIEIAQTLGLSRTLLGRYLKRLDDINEQGEAYFEPKKKGA